MRKTAEVIKSILYTAALGNVYTFLEYVVIFSTGKEVDGVTT